jgi:hypothetical protein
VGAWLASSTSSRFMEARVDFGGAVRLPGLMRNLLDFGSCQPALPRLAVPA